MDTTMPRTPPLAWHALDADSALRRPGSIAAAARCVLWVDEARKAFVRLPRAPSPLPTPH